MELITFVLLSFFFDRFYCCSVQSSVRFTFSTYKINTDVNCVIKSIKDIKFSKPQIVVIFTDGPPRPTWAPIDLLSKSSISVLPLFVFISQASFFPDNCIPENCLDSGTSCVLPKWRAPPSLRLLRRWKTYGGVARLRYRGRFTEEKMQPRKAYRTITGIANLLLMKRLPRKFISRKFATKCRCRPRSHFAWPGGRMTWSRRY